MLVQHLPEWDQHINNYIESPEFVVFDSDNNVITQKIEEFLSPLDNKLTNQQ